MFTSSPIVINESLTTDATDATEDTATTTTKWPPQNLLKIGVPVIIGLVIIIAIALSFSSTSTPAVPVRPVNPLAESRVPMTRVQPTGIQKLIAMAKEKPELAAGIAVVVVVVLVAVLVASSRLLFPSPKKMPVVVERVKVVKKLTWTDKVWKYMNGLKSHLDLLIG